ncbi:MAG: transcription-repair coupling factor [Clostridia bacterium]|nr:transcription-repair coupling factor [Clostridia bacterium]
MSVFDKILTESEEYNKILKAVNSGGAPVHVTGVTEAEKAHLLYSLFCHTGKKIFILTANDRSAKKLESDIKPFIYNTVHLKEKELSLRKVDAMGHDALFERLKSLYMANDSSLVIASVNSLLQPVTPKDAFDAGTLTFAAGDEYDLPELCKKLSEIGYARCDTVETKGNFALRGGILDIFSPDSDYPVRMEFFGDEIDTIRYFDPESQLSTERTDSVKVIPADEIEETGSVLSYIPEDWLFCFDEPLRISEQAKAIKEEVSERVKTLMENDMLKEVKDKYINDYSALMAEISKRQIVSLAAISLATPDFRPKELLSLTVKSMQPYNGNTEMLTEDILYYKEKKFRIIVMAGSKERIKAISEVLFEKGISTSTDEDTLPERGVVLLLHGSFSGGYEYPLINTVVISDRQMLSFEKKKYKRKLYNASDLISYTELSVGDYVVHETHGIGKFMGMQKINAAGSIKEYLKIAYHGEDVLYVPATQLDMLHKYKSSLAETDGEKKSVKLNRLGGTEWSKTKSNVKKNVFELAEKLVKLYAERSALKGHSFPADDNWQREFEEEFIYEETEDQKRSIAEMKDDMESDKCMDRLLLGDVGFGKTEVAMRGAFKCVCDNKQVAYLVPTTVLAAQQYANFVERMKNYPITVEMLSRFKNKRAQDDIIRRTKRGEVDILIGTHRILSKDVEFKDLGLLIIDEEQRFGVGHKESIKELKKNIDVLSLSATPIPRSLNMAMIGIRDMSILSMPPEDRLPVQTFAMEYNESVVNEAIERELSRSGQVYYLFNRITGIYKVAERIKQSFPDANIAVGHGQMNERELEDIMMKMVEGEIDILVCTTIIETGLDIPNVNTIIIEDADRIGLSQLYQLRGRVGRSSRLAYAYLTYRKDKVLSEIAEKRLKAIREFTEFGSGFRIAMRDLELRGAGNILGPEQSGFMMSVGYEVYCNLLTEAVASARGEAVPEKEECLVDLDISAYIPESYVSDGNTRIQMYKKIAGILDLSDSYLVEEELEDRFGDIPRETKMLIDVAMIRSEARKMGISEIGKKNERILIYPSERFKDIPGTIASLNGVFRGKVMFASTGRPCIYVRCGELNAENTLEFVKKVLQNLKCGE